MNPLKVYTALMATTLLWGVSFILTKVALTSFTPFSLIFFRFSIASIFFLLYFLWKGFPRLTKNQHVRLATLSFFEPVLYFLFETSGLQRTTAAEASLIIALIPALVLLLSYLFLKERIARIAQLGIALSILGIVLLMMGENGLQEYSGSSLKGNFLVLGAVVSAACYTLLSRSLGQEISSFVISAYQFFYGTAFFFPLFLLFPKGTGQSIGVSVLGALLFLAFGATIGAFLCYNYALSKAPAATVSVFINGIPVVTAFTGWLILGETLKGSQLLGAIVVVIGVTLTSIHQQQRDESLHLA
ncbi:MAG: DMT family transporter [Spirochaetes bacterium]|nr:DMT family transporter [Spirochaetota bacterium]